MRFLVDLPRLSSGIVEVQVGGLEGTLRHGYTQRRAETLNLSGRYR